MIQIEKWGVFELCRKGKCDGNPCSDYRIRARFTGEREEKTVEGFYDGDGVYRIRFMPFFEGIYTYVISGDFADTIEEPEGIFLATAPTVDNHGPVEANGTRLVYADGTRYDSFGTTCYAWAVQQPDLQEQTLSTLEHGPFNKIRFCIFPKFYEYNTREPLTLPFLRGQGEGLDAALVATEAQDKLYFPGMKIADPDFGFDYLRPNPEHFKHYDQQIRLLMELGIEADLILMHPYDRWGMNQMNRKACEQYLRYVTARYGAFRNVWWSLANEYDLIFSRKIEDWDFYGETVSEADPYGHLLSIHNCSKAYDFSRPWITHCSLQRMDFYKTTENTDEYLTQYNKPVVWDEICYEGNLGLGWGNITAEEMVRRFWEGTLRGGHCGHGETYLDPNDILWWSHGGVLKGESPARIQFLRDIVKEVPGEGLTKGRGMFDELVAYWGGQTGSGWTTWYDNSIHYLGITRPALRNINLPEGIRYNVELIDTWNMTITPLGIMTGFNTIQMPERQYMALRITRVDPPGENM